MTKHTQEPWKHVLGHDTHKVKRDAAGRMLGPVTMDLDDYDRACECVNALAGINPEAVSEMIGALEGALAYLAPPASKFKENRDAAVEAIRSALAKARETH